MTIMTVTGPLPPDQLGLTSIHEHIFSDLSRDRPGAATLLNNAGLAHRELMGFKDAGGATVVDQTTAGLRGHDHDIVPVKHALAIRQMAERTGLNIVLGAGWYRELHYEKHLYRMRTNEIADDLVRDIEQGIDGTDVRAGILGEIGTQFTWVSPVEERMYRAVARAHEQTGVTIATHALFWPVGLDQLDLLAEEGVDPGRVIVGHCQSYPDHAYHAEIARRGAFVAFDRMGSTNAYTHETDLGLIKQMVDAGLTRHVLLGHDVCYRDDYVVNGGRGYAYIPGAMEDDLREIGVAGEQFRQMTVENPRRALSGEE